MPFGKIYLALLLFTCTGTDSFAEDRITFTEHIAPIVYNNCTSCHRPNQSAPFSLISYRDVRRRSRTIAAVVERRYMPPWLPHGGDVKLKGQRRLTQNEIDMVLQWVKDGSPQGDPSVLKSPPVFSDDKWVAGKPDLVLQMTEAYPLPAEGPDIYQQFVIPTNLKEDKWLKAVAFLPGTPSVVHHSLFYLDNSGQARAADKADPEPGFRDMPIGGSMGKHIGSWVPGMNPMFKPKGLSTKLEPNGDLVISTHFHLTGKPEKEISTVGLYFTDKPSEKSSFLIQLPPLFGLVTGFDILPESTDTSVTDEFILPVDVNAYWVSAHAHYLGKTIRLTAELPGGEEIILLNIPDWDFNWQEVYAFEEQLNLPAGTRLKSVVTWDNSSENTDNPNHPPVRVRWGKESYDEMASIDLYVLSDSKKDIDILRKKYTAHQQKPWIDHNISEDRFSFGKKLIAKGMGKFDLNKDGKLDSKEKSAARAYLEKLNSQQ